MEYDKSVINEMEKQRYDYIKNTGRYMELNILVGHEPDAYKNKMGRFPVISNTLNKVTTEDIAIMYAVIKSMMEYYQKEYPEACLLSELTVTNSHLADIYVDTDDEEDE